MELPVGTDGQVLAVENGKWVWRDPTPEELAAEEIRKREDYVFGFRFMQELS